MYEFKLLRKTLIKILNLTSSVYNFNKNGSETEKNDIETIYFRRQSVLGDDHVAMQAVWGQRLKACWYLSMWARKSR